MLGTSVVVALFAVLFVVAALHAVLVQTQAQIDAQRAANAAVQAELAAVTADLARVDSPEGLEQWAIDAGLVLAPEVVILSPVVPGTLAPPISGDPFFGGGGVSPAGRRPGRSRSTTSARPTVCPNRLRTLCAVFIIVIGGFGYRLADLQLTPDQALAEPISRTLRTRTCPLNAGRSSTASADRWPTHGLPRQSSRTLG